MKNVAKKNKRAGSFATIAFGSVLAVLSGCKTVHTEIEIEAKPATVWKILSDTKGYAQWNPVHVKIEGEYREGADVKVHLKNEKGEISVLDSTVRIVIPEKHLNQGGGIPGIFTFDHTFRLEPTGHGTKVIHQERFRGIGVLFFSTAWVERSYQRVNEALKEKAESQTE